MVIAVDFDGTLCKHKFPGIGEVEDVHKAVAEYLKARKSLGDTIVLWTCREDLTERKYLTEAVEWCKAQGIPIDFVNEYPMPEFKGFAARKVCADIYIDDKAVNIAETLYHQNLDRISKMTETVEIELCKCVNTWKETYDRATADGEYDKNTGLWKYKDQGKAERALYALESYRKASAMVADLGQSIDNLIKD